MFTKIFKQPGLCIALASSAVSRLDVSGEACKRWQ